LLVALPAVLNEPNGDNLDEGKKMDYAIMGLHRLALAVRLLKVNERDRDIAPSALTRCYPNLENNRPLIVFPLYRL
jgi:hypothetical protein